MIAFGFEFEKTLCMFDRHIKQENKFIKIISQNIEELIFIEVDISNRKIISKRYVKNWNRLDKCEMNEHYIKDLIKADLVEEVYIMIPKFRALLKIGNIYEG